MRRKRKGVWQKSNPRKGRAACRKGDKRVVATAEPIGAYLQKEKLKRGFSGQLSEGGRKGTLWRRNRHFWGGKTGSKTGGGNKRKRKRGRIGLSEKGKT